MYLYIHNLLVVKALKQTKVDLELWDICYNKNNTFVKQLRKNKIKLQNQPTKKK